MSLSYPAVDESRYPGHVAEIGETVVFAHSSDWVLSDREPLIVCKRGWVEIDEMR